ncbi:MAG: prepilin-type N-terminal cleavage/methylation domain-containing protein [Oscillospiraceae bacterium]|nr:prepilin-type N-terminal cleavage/methylation domain-containing protein [Oscillospiraceae bacterium]
MIKRKKLKGFTLVEIIVALAVFAIMSLIVTLIIQMSSAIMKDSQYTAKKADTQSIIAGNKTFTSADDDSIVTKVTIEGATLSSIKTIEIEGKSNRDTEYDDNAFYENAPNIKVFTDSGNKTF